MIRVIYISWRKQAGSRRHIVAKIKRNASGVIFQPFPRVLEQAKADGLDYLAGFHDLEKVTNKDVTQLINHRVIGKDRPDRQQFLSFWEAENATDNFEILALTQGSSPTDNLEFLGEYHPQKGTKFVTDLAGLSHIELPKDFLKIGDKLSFKMEKDNPVDRKAVAVYRENVKVGYIKQIHCRFFQDLKHPVSLTVKALDQNGRIKNVFIVVEL
ncbi:MAG: hypothetical protein RLZZ306_296 [Bacteroidota bacterium]